MGAAAPIPLALILWLAANGALAAFMRDAVWIPLAVFPREMTAPYPTFWPPWPVASDIPGRGAWAFRLVCLLPPLAFGVSALGMALSGTVHRKRQCPARYAARAAWLAFGLVIWATAFPRADFDHVQVALAPVFVLGAAAMESAGRFAVRRRIWRLWLAPAEAVPAQLLLAPPPEPGDLTGRPDRWSANTAIWPASQRAATAVRKWHAWFAQRFDGVWCRRYLPQTLSGLVIAGFLVTGVGLARGLHMGPEWTLRTLDRVAPRGSGIRLDHDDAAELIRPIAEVRRLSAPGEAIVSLPWNAGLYFLAERRNATRFDLFIPASVLPDDLPEIEASLDQARLIVYWTARDPFIGNTSLEDRTPDLHQRVMSRYRAVAAVNAYRLLLRE